MSFIVLGRLKDNSVCILDTDDLVTDVFSDSEFKSIQKMGIHLLKASKSTLNIGIISNENKYQLYMNGCEIPIYSGEFPTISKRNDLFSFEIELKDFNIVNNKLVVAIIANCWCKYDIEVPMVMCHILYAPIRNIKNMTYACKTDEPVYFCTKDILDKQYNQCQGDFPDKSLSPNDMYIDISKSGVKVFGIEYKNEVPIYDILDTKLNFNVVKDI